MCLSKGIVLSRIKKTIRIGLSMRGRSGIFSLTVEPRTRKKDRMSSSTALVEAGRVKCHPDRSDDVTIIIDRPWKFNTITTMITIGSLREVMGHLLLDVRSGLESLNHPEERPAANENIHVNSKSDHRPQEGNRHPVP